MIKDRLPFSSNVLLYTFLVCGYQKCSPQEMMHHFMKIEPCLHKSFVMLERFHLSASSIVIVPKNNNKNEKEDGFNTNEECRRY